MGGSILKNGVHVYSRVAFKCVSKKSVFPPRERIHDQGFEYLALDARIEFSGIIFQYAFSRMLFKFCP